MQQPCAVFSWLQAKRVLSNANENKAETCFRQNSGGEREIEVIVSCATNYRAAGVDERYRLSWATFVLAQIFCEYDK
jgi:hypothetical protein